MKKIMALLLTVMFLAGIFAGCAKKSSSDAPDEKGDKFGGTLNIGTFADPDTLNPLVGNDMAGSWILNNIYPTLMVLDEEGNKVPYIIEEPEISEDGLTVTITLKDGLKWQDGTALTSADIIYTYEILEKEKLQWQYEVLEGVTMEAPDDKTVVFTLSTPFPTFITTIGFWQRIVPAHIWSEVEDVKNFTNDKPVGLGPFKLTDYERGQYYVLESVEQWPLSPEGRPYLDKVIFKPYPDVNTMVLALKSGDIDLTAKEIPAAAAKEIQGDDQFTVVQNMSLGYEHMAINLHSNKLLQDNALRTAMAMAVDRKKVIDFSFDGEGVEMTGYVSPVYEKFQIGNDLPDYDVEGAKKVLADAGYKDTDNDGVLNAPSGEKLSFKVMFASTVTEHEKMARILVDQMKDIGIEIIPEPMDKSLQSDKLYNTHEWELSLGTWGILDDMESSLSTLFHSTAALNFMGWSNPVADEAMMNMKSSISEEETMKDMDVFQKEIVKEVPDIPVFVKKLNFAYRNNFDGFRLLPSNLKGLVDPQSLQQVHQVK
ncbi:ABC transporter substrate-binding protein [Irregularibacter muris]|uniref:ABC transporter substrate-binding protein n=1 Tax=Irregularibacter muris TaxID=1796619 RepID=A0AAE3HH44_9FIRM|nr:ABC transporter substrate-binding protein [Irregularibacter muris]MCR1899334.1 ABC transporter substrate-binding protein [Irregularibacter muris]